jgi:hypothetical protein
MPILLNKHFSREIKAPKLSSEQYINHNIFTFTNNICEKCAATLFSRAAALSAKLYKERKREKF